MRAVLGSVSLRLTPKDIQVLEAAAAAKGKKRSVYLRDVVRRHLRNFKAPAA